MRSYFLFCAFVTAFACGGQPTVTNINVATANNTNTNKASASVTIYTYDIVKTYPHDPKAFTQGLVFHEGFLFEGTGGKPSRGDDFFSSVRKVALESGKVLQKYDVPPEFFGEGITILGEKVYQLTWQERTGFVYNLSDFKLLKEVRYVGDGWGLTNDGTNLIMSDGTHVIKIIDPETFQTLRTIVVMNEKGQPLMKLNELEYIGGEIWANVWETGWIVRIDPATGKLLGRIDLNKLADDEMNSNENADVLNGIAHDAASGRIFVTGKNWKRLFEIKVRPK
ncbi:MAG: glutaminyl-peptide cyclotransferase [Saprospiraceae bacterium]|nr:glutaminyl-peptide cyclotransferase [Pyrinomonadaceae bacterium]